VTKEVAVCCGGGDRFGDEWASKCRGVDAHGANFRRFYHRPKEVKPTCVGLPQPIWKAFRLADGI
jgi:hypothetical protein